MVIGAPSIWPDPETGRGEPSGLAARIALGVAAEGASVQLAGKVGDDPAGDEVLLALARAGVLHDAVLRDPDRATPLASAVAVVPADASAAADALLAGIDERSDEADRAVEGAPGPALDAADLALCLSYLREFAVVVVAEPLDPAGLAAVAGAAAFAGAALVVIVPPGGEARSVPPDATVLEGPVEDQDDDFARLVARYAISLEHGGEPASAFRLALAGAGWEAVGSQPSRAGGASG